LIGVIAQSLLPQKSGNGRVLATEVMVSNVAIQNLISRGALNEIRGQLDANINGPSYTLGRCLADLIRRDLISKEVARQYIKNPADLEYYIKSSSAAPLSRLSQNQMDNLFEKSIVVIDRDQKQRILVQERLKAKGFLNVYTLAKNSETMEKVHFLRPDIVILDSLHEFMLTSDFCREIKALEFNPKILVIADDTHAAEIIAATQAPGAEAVVVRSSESELLLKAISKIDFTNRPVVT
jgi:CheY-like chemotaxis protein